MPNGNNLNAHNNINSLPKLVKMLRLTLLAVAIGVAQAVIAPAVQAAEIIVNNSGDANFGCTLREAVQSINQSGVGGTGCFNSGGPFASGPIDSIVFPTNLNTITLSNTPLDINRTMRMFASVPNVLLQGTTIQRDVPSSNNRLMTIEGPISVELANLTLIGGTNVGALRGAAIYVKNGRIDIRNSVIQDGLADLGGGILLDGAVGTLHDTTVRGNDADNGGGIWAENSSTLTVFNSTISNNSSGNAGGGIGLDSSSIATINTSTIAGNSARQGACIYASSSTVTVNQSVVWGNVSSNIGGGIRGVFSPVLLANSTVSGNDGGLWGGGVSSRNAAISIINSTVSNNTAERLGAGLYAFGGTSDGSPNFSLSNSIIANSTGADDCEVEIASITASRYNIIEDGSCGTAAKSADPRLKPLADNGGPTLTHALSINSPAISAGLNLVCTASPINSRDQRGEPRANPDDTICDLGAFESPEGRANTSTFFVIPIKNGKTVIFDL